MPVRGTVLVTGGSGYVAGFCLAQLLREGWQARTTVRNLAREPEVRATLKKLCDPGDRLAFFAADLNQDAGWAEAAQGCDYILHVASPLPSTIPKNDAELVVPARDGTLRVLRAARAAGVKRVVLTASTASICYGHGGRPTPFTEADWTDETNLADTSAYERSKTIAERAARDWQAREGGTQELVTIHPGAILGPVLNPDLSASIDIVKKLLEGSVPGIPRFGWPLVDVRDVADLHVLAMTAPGIAGERFLCAGPFWWMVQVAQVLREKLPGQTRNVPTRQLPNWLVRIAAWFDPVVRGRLFELDKERPVTSQKAQQRLGWMPRSNEEAIVATAESLLAAGIVKE